MATMPAFIFLSSFVGLLLLSNVNAMQATVLEHERAYRAENEERARTAEQAALDVEDAQRPRDQVDGEAEATGPTLNLAVGAAESIDVEMDEYAS
jgi:hypothetical protein